ncbi:MAG: DoxX family protein [Gammaproteobacteria bacterium]|nr:DoxX family protein [Gammaproteobacteria bacterium]
MATATRNPLVTLIDKTINGITFLSPLLDLAIRLWVARVFWLSGQTKIQSWESTLMLFEYEYAVPVLPFEVAAYAATAVELVAPVMLVLGLGTRLGALSLFVLNYVATISYPDINIAGIKDHMLWGTMLAVSFFHGPGKLSVDHWIRGKILS